MAIHEEIKAKGAPDFTSLYEHLEHVKKLATTIAIKLGYNVEIAALGAIMHDIGKAHTTFQKRLTSSDKSFVFRHEIASMFFISLLSDSQKDPIIEMVIAHHKSVMNDAGQKGLHDLIEVDANFYSNHLGDWENWSPAALDILGELGITTQPISRQQAIDNLNFVIKHTEELNQQRGYSEWKGLLMAADHLGSALANQIDKITNTLFNPPILKFYERIGELYPLSKREANSEKPHTIVVASTGAGKTDYLFRRCKPGNRVFYTLPYQASINAMYKRVKSDLKNIPDLDIRLLHASSSLSADGNTEKVLQSHIGSSIKILTPHQIAAIVFGTRGYEAIIIDIKGQDVILDEIHSYNGITRAIVLKIVQVLHHLGCRVHIGTATMPSILYNKILEILSPQNVHQEKLSQEELDKFNRHIIHKIEAFDSILDVLDQAILNNQKVLIVCNRVDRAQNTFKFIDEKYPNTEKLLIHSRFKRGRRAELEKLLIGKDENGDNLGIFNTSTKACIVVSTQVVEVSLDISFDIMVTESAPLDALIQRFGRINRIRNNKTIGTYKPIYVIAPYKTQSENLPYELEIVNKSFNILPDNEVLQERFLQSMMDQVFTEIDSKEIEMAAKFKSNNKWAIAPLQHQGKSYLLEALEIDSVSCILDEDLHEYEAAHSDDRLHLEIPMNYRAARKYSQSDKGNRPFIVPASMYCDVYGLQKDNKTEFL